MLVEWKGQGPLSFTKPNPTIRRDNKTGKSFKTVLTSGDVVIMVPGINPLPTDFWKSLERNRNVQRMISDNQLSVIREDDGDPEKAKKEGVSVELQGLDVAASCDIVKKVMNKKVLDKWFEEETRRKVIVTIERQLDTLKIKPRKDDD